MGSGERIIYHLVGDEVYILGGSMLIVGLYSRHKVLAQLLKISLIMTLENFSRKKMQ